MITLLDGPLGTELSVRGVRTELPLWSAAAIESSPQTIAEIHRDYVEAGATVHTANTFRTKRRYVGENWRDWTSQAVELARNAVSIGHLVAGSLSPLEDCYRPDLSPPDCRGEHREMAFALRDSGCDLILCETFPHVGEFLVAIEEAVQTGLPVWAALTAGPHADLLSTQQAGDAAKRAVANGAEAVFINCTPARQSLPFVRSLADAELGVPIGCYANAGSQDDVIGWQTPTEAGVDDYAELAKQWTAAGASILGGCCGTGPAHIARLKAFLGNIGD